MVINRHPQGDVMQRHIKPMDPIYTCNVKKNNGSHKHKDVDTIDNVMLTYC